MRKPKAELGLDPVTAFANLITAFAELAKVAMQGQTPEQSAQIWAWYIEDVKFWRKVFKVERWTKDDAAARKRTRRLRAERVDRKTRARARAAKADAATRARARALRRATAAK